MIRAAQKTWFKKLWRAYIRLYLLWRHFAVIRLKGEIDPSNDDTKPPVIYIANHSNWWDGLLAFDVYLPRSQHNHFVMMDERQVRQFKFFRWLGVFSIDKSSSSGVMESLRYATELLGERHAVWVFPQGDIQHPEIRPLRFFSGVGYLLQNCPQAVVVPVTIYYSFSKSQKPEASLWFGRPLVQSWGDLERKDITEYVRKQLEMQLDMHRDLYMLDENLEEAGFKVVMRTRSTDQRFVDFKKWVKRWFTRSQ